MGEGLSLLCFVLFKIAATQFVVGIGCYGPVRIDVNGALEQAANGFAGIGGEGHFASF